MSVIQAAPFELAALCVQMRKDWEPRTVEGAIQAARAAGWSWERTYRYMSVLLLDETASPRSLAEAARNPLERTAATPTGVAKRYADAYRAAREDSGSAR